MLSIKGGEKMEIDLEIDNEDIPLNKFIKNILTNILDGIVKELHGVDKDWQELEIKLKK